MVAFPRAVIVFCNLVHCFTTFSLTFPSSLLKLPTGKRVPTISGIVSGHLRRNYSLASPVSVLQCTRMSTFLSVFNRTCQTTLGEWGKRKLLSVFLFEIVALHVAIGVAVLERPSSASGRPGEHVGGSFGRVWLPAQSHLHQVVHLFPLISRG